MEGAKIEVLHDEHREWINKLDFYKEDLTILRKRHDEVATKNTSQEVMAMVEHFQSQFIIQRNEIDEFRHAIKEHENHLQAAINNNPVAINRQRLHDHPEMRERMARFEKLFQEFRMDLLHFVSKYI
jgi:excinuclease UvrABC helicase subunit UvrB